MSYSEFFRILISYRKIVCYFFCQNNLTNKNTQKFRIWDGEFGNSNIQISGFQNHLQTNSSLHISIFHSQFIKYVSIWDTLSIVQCTSLRDFENVNDLEKSGNNSSQDVFLNKWSNFLLEFWCPTWKSNLELTVTYLVYYIFFYFYSLPMSGKTAEHTPSNTIYFMYRMSQDKNREKKTWRHKTKDSRT